MLFFFCKQLFAGCEAMGLCVDIQVLYYDDGETKKRNLVFCAVETISYPV